MYLAIMLPLVQPSGSLAFAFAWGFLPLGSSVKMKAPSSSMFRYRVLVILVGMKTFETSAKLNKTENES